MKEARDTFQLELSDRSTLEASGQAQLTSEERKYYEKVIEKRSFDGVEDVMPKTIFERVFEDLQREHPLLSKIDFHNTTGSMRWILRTEECVGAFWGKLTDAITKELDNGFTKEDMALAKLTAFVPVSKAMLDLGPVWLDRFVRAMLAGNDINCIRRRNYCRDRKRPTDWDVERFRWCCSLRDLS